MRPELFNVFAEVLDAADPRKAGERLLRYVCRLVDAGSAALFEVRGEGIRLTLGVAVDAAALADANTLWGQGKHRLLDSVPVNDASETHSRPPSLAVPLKDLRSGDVVGVVYLHQCRAPLQDRATLCSLLKLVAKALLRDAEASVLRNSEWEAVLTEHSSNAERARVMAAMQRNEGNLTRAARELGITRQTLYTWLTRHHIPRIRPQRG